MSHVSMQPVFCFRQLTNKCNNDHMSECTHSPVLISQLKKKQEKTLSSWGGIFLFFFDPRRYQMLATLSSWGERLLRRCVVQSYGGPVELSLPENLNWGFQQMEEPYQHSSITTHTREVQVAHLIFTHFEASLSHCLWHHPRCEALPFFQPGISTWIYSLLAGDKVAIIIIIIIIIMIMK